MTTLLSERIQLLDNSEIAKLEEYTEYLIFKRSIKSVETLNDDIPTKDIINLISNSEAFNWLNSSEEDVYSPIDGVPAQW